MLCPPSTPISMRMRSATAYELREYPVDRVRVQKGDLEPEQAAAGMRIHQLDPFGGEPVEFGADVDHLVRDVMHPWAARGQEPTDRPVGAECGEQLHAAHADEYGRGLDALILDVRAMLDPRAE